MKDHIGPVGGAFLLETTDPARTFTPEDLSAEDLLIGKTADEFLRREVLPLVERIEGGDVPLMDDLMRKAGALGLLGADVPTIYGGLGLRRQASALIAEKVNWQQSFALSHEAHTVIATLPLLYFGNHDQKSRYLPKLATGEWIGAFALSEQSDWLTSCDLAGNLTGVRLREEGAVSCTASGRASRSERNDRRSPT